uniref:Ig-like domain-containing protein n=1 Tax=Chrysemys picta bellii TaxID=8478 RepID=A0A8C3P7A1_CHRPI
DWVMWVASSSLGVFAAFPHCGGRKRQTKPSISVSPSEVIALGGAVTIRCQCRCEARRLFLYKGGIQIQELDAAGDGGEFTIPSARREDGGFYSCQSRSRSEPPNWSDPSEMVWIIVVGEGPGSVSLLPTPHPARPSWGSLGRWDTPWGNVRFLLYKDGKWTMLQDMDAAVDLVEFPIRNVSWRDAGSYSCYYCSKWYPFTWSHPSDPVELVVAGEGPGSVSPLPAPHPAGPSGAGACARGKQAQGSPKSVGLEIRTPLGNAGNYSCQYSTKWDPPIWSEPSDPVELVVAGEGPGSASPLPAAHPAGPSGGLGPFGILRARPMAGCSVPSFPHPSQCSFSFHRGIRLSWAPAAGSPKGGARGRK